MDAQVAVVGAGPSGLIAAREAAKRGAHVVVLEEHMQIGLPVECAGLLSLRGLRAIGLRPEGHYVLNRQLRGARFVSPGGRELLVEAGEPVACVVDRRLLDLALAEQAERAGAEVLLGRKVLAISRLPSGVSLSGRWGSLQAQVAVVAEGFRSRLVRRLGLRTVDWRRVLPASQVELRVPELAEDLVEVWLGSRVAPGLFAWVIPLGDGIARVGLACRRGLDPRELLAAFLRRRLGVRLPPGLRRPPYAGSVLTCGPIPRTYADRVVIVGDAAGQAKPTTGGGVILGGLCALLAGRTVAEAVEAGDTSEEALRAYELAWRRLLGRDFRAMSLARRLLDRLPDRALDLAVKTASELDLGREIAREADMDLQSRVLAALPRLALACLARRLKAL